MMDIKLTGYNVGVELARDGICHCSCPVTPETMCATYARISRSSDSIATIRSKAAVNVKTARSSNERIIFDMGHASIAEHAVFNFDIVGVSRLVVEAIEHSRLASYTEKSQRYVTFDPTKKEYMIPQELIGTSFEEPFRNFVEYSHCAYHTIYDNIRHQERTEGGAPEEDARYVTPLATTTQLGMTINGRSLGAMIRRLRSLTSAEAKAIGDALYNEVKDVAPSLFCHCEPEPSRQQLVSAVRSIVKLYVEMPPSAFTPVSLTCGPVDGYDLDGLLLAHLIHQTSNAALDTCHKIAAAMSSDLRRILFNKIYQCMSSWTAVPRQWELMDLTFEIICSASCFAQLKRHRIATIIPQDYNPSLGYTVPTSIKRNGAALLRFNKTMLESNDLYNKLLHEFGTHIADYVLTQAHRRRVILRMNLRELYHFSRLREDAHAQWEIRNLANCILDHVRKIAPLSMTLACGKDKFEERKKDVLDNV